MSYPVIDAHQHFWKYDPQRDGWMTEEMGILRKDYLPTDLEQVFIQQNVQGSILVQADASEKENVFFLNLADQYSFIRAVVGWIDLQSDKIEERLNYYRQFPKLKGFRHLLQGESRRDLMLTADFQKGIALLERYGFSFDLLILKDQLGHTERLTKIYPDQRFVIDHLAKPDIKHGIISEWKQGISQFKSLENVYCKISGMVSEADWEYWEKEDFRPYMDTVLETFGTKRIMFGSDWPVCLVAGSYAEVKSLVADYFSSFSTTEQADFFGNNASLFYQIK